MPGTFRVVARGKAAAAGIFGSESPVAAPRRTRRGGAAAVTRPAVRRVFYEVRGAQAAVDLHPSLALQLQNGGPALAAER